MREFKNKELPKPLSSYDNTLVRELAQREISRNLYNFHVDGMSCYRECQFIQDKWECLGDCRPVTKEDVDYHLLGMDEGEP